MTNPNIAIRSCEASLSALKILPFSPISFTTRLAVG